MGTSTFEYGEITSDALSGNLIGDPATRSYWVYLPPDYDTETRRYPVVYVLHWYKGDKTALITDVRPVLERLHSAGGAQDMILVFPDAGNTFGGSWCMSSPTIGDYETYITSELVEQIDASFRTIPQRDSRGVTGCSMGGDGAMHLALQHPDVFGAVVGVSGTYDYENDPLWEKARELFKEAPGDLTDFRALPWQVQWYIAGAAATASNPDKPPFYLDMPFEVVDGETQIVQEVWEKIKASDTVHDVQRYLEQPTRLNAVMIYHGDRDNIASVDNVRAFGATLSDLGVEHEYIEVEGGGHCDLDWEPVIQFMSDNLVSETPEEAAEPGATEAVSGYVDNDGVRIYYEVEGEGTPLVLVHWASGSTKDWHMFGYVDTLEEDYQLILVDMRGHGQSDKPLDPEAYSAEIQVGDIIAVLDELGIDKAHYFGYSLGGRLGWAVARYAPERFHSIIIGGKTPAVWDDSEWAT
jgi:pimeloyl-ACP methyl ester carboxylesterase